MTILSFYIEKLHQKKNFSNISLLYYYYFKNFYFNNNLYIDDQNY